MQCNLNEPRIQLHKLSQAVYAASLEAHKIPKLVEAVDSIPRTFNGKIDRKKIIAQYNQK